MILDKRIPLKYILNKVKYYIMGVAIIGLLTHYFTISFDGLLPVMPLSIPAFLGTAISILLSFKMNQSYDRWWEARKVWGAIVNDSRSLVIQLQSFLPEGDVNAVNKIAYRQIAWCHTLGKSLKGLNAIEGSEHLIDETDRMDLANHANKPLALLQQHARDIKQLRANNKVDTFSHIQLDNTLVRLCDSMGKAERIRGTVFPSTYRQFLHFIIYIFLVTLSISLIDVNVVFELPLLLVISSGFFLIEKSAYHLQDPFSNRPSDIPIIAIATTIEINIRQLLGEKEVPEPAKPIDFYLM